MRCDKRWATAFSISVAALWAASAAAQPQPWTTGTIVYDAAGNITAMGADSYFYDSAGRLVRGTADQQRSGGTNRQDYSYDGAGNRRLDGTFGAGCINGCGATDVTFDVATNRISNHGATYGDGAGNVTTFDGYVYAYDGAGMLARQQGPIGNPIDWQYVYTADDERIATYTGSGNWQFTLRDIDGEVLRELVAAQSGGGTTTWVWTRDNIFRDGLLLASLGPSSSRQQFHLDHIGTPRLVTDGGGVQRGLHSFYPFGEELSLGAAENPPQRLKYTGHERDETAGGTLDYMHARYYSPTAGRFLSPDPLPGSPDTPQSWNRYGYVLGNPVALTDPAGLYVVDPQCEANPACKGAANSFEIERKTALFAGSRQGNRDVVAAAEAFGAPGVPNGVTVNFMSQAQINHLAGAPQGYNVDGLVSPHLTLEGNQLHLTMTAVFSVGLVGEALEQTIVHEGSHILDDRSIVSSWNPKTKTLTSMTHFDTERKAYMLGAKIAPYTRTIRGVPPFKDQTFTYSGGANQGLMDAYIYHAYPNYSDYLFGRVRK